MKPIYLDYNASTPLTPRVREAMLPYLDEFYGNPSSSHWYGRHAKKAIEKARQQIADFIGAETDEIIFTSGGSEANNLAITGYVMANEHHGKHIITSAIEHPAVENVCNYLTRIGFRVTVVPVDKYGRVNPEHVKQSITSDTILISIMHANNEVGTIQPIAEIADIAHEHNIVMHTDAAQSPGKIPVKVQELKVDMLSIAGHKLYAPKGVGALYVRRGTHLQKIIFGADHERDMRAGTENVLEIVGLGEACAEANETLTETANHLSTCTDRLWQHLQKLATVQRNGHAEFHLPNTLNVSFYGIEANTLLAELDDIAASAGAACHSDDITVSTVLQAMKLPMDWAMGTIRFSVGKMTTVEEIDQAAAMIIEAVNRLSNDAPQTEIQDNDDIRLTRFTHGLGCACKLQPQALEKVLQGLPVPEHPDILIGTATSDDAAVFKINEDTAIVQTVDFFTPIVDDAYEFGAITAANALSDIYAMGATPQFALNIVAFPSNRLPLDVLHNILHGASDKAQEAGVVIVGGHTIDDTEPKYGLAVTGILHPEKIWKNVGAQPGDALILTKSLGTGILSTALKQRALSTAHANALIDSMSRLNKSAAETASAFNIHACTDITGFGLLGHLHEMLAESNVEAVIQSENTPILPGTLEALAQEIIPGGTKANLSFAESFTTFAAKLPKRLHYILADAQTSGGLLFAMPQKDAEHYIWEFNQQHEHQAVQIGMIRQGNGKIFVE